MTERKLMNDRTVDVVLIDKNPDFLPNIYGSPGWRLGGDYPVSRLVVAARNTSGSLAVIAALLSKVGYEHTGEIVDGNGSFPDIVQIKKTESGEKTCETGTG